jgi:putative hydrolase of the HAD superfamily
MTSAPHRPAAFLFDIGGTILREDSYDLLAGVRALEPQRDAEILTRDLQASIDHVHLNNSSEFKLARWLADNSDYFPKQRSVLELELTLWCATASLSPMPGVVQTLVALRELGLPIGCISNAVFSGPVLRYELDRHGLGVDFVISSADLEIRKPDPRIFFAAVSKMGLTPSVAVWFVGDSWAADICGAAGAGIFPVWLSQPEEPLPPGSACARVASWSELRSLVASAIAA